ncbi:vacuolar ATPase assembly integral membrane protein vma21 [Marasmius tenuissimus]|uniref:Vacuolar ATPase assembly integral membrane protein vma21 n=1 Tax=Marasmius tenuissimus TaxID=585030 RepID=A0ABR3AA73_9AGAR
MSEQVAVANAVADAAPGGTLVKLIIFSICLGIAPLGSYYASLNYIWNGNATFAAITAVVAANVVLITYIILSLLEDKSAPVQRKTETKKQR